MESSNTVVSSEERQLQTWSIATASLDFRTTVLSFKMNLLETQLERAADASNNHEITRNMQAKQVVNEQKLS